MGNCSTALLRGETTQPSRPWCGGMARWFWPCAAVSFVLSVSRAKEKDGQAKQAPAPPKENEGEITGLEAIGLAYSRNDALGDAKFAGKQLRVTGKVFGIRRVHGSYWLTFRHGTYPTRFKFNYDAQRLLAELRYDQEVTIEGRCEGNIADADNAVRLFGQQPTIGFTNCKVISVGK